MKFVDRNNNHYQNDIDRIWYIFVKKKHFFINMVFIEFKKNKIENR